MRQRQHIGSLAHVVHRLDDPSPDGEPARRWRVRQVLDDPDGFHEWAIVVEVDVDASDAEGVAVVRPLAVEQL